MRAGLRQTHPYVGLQIMESGDETISEIVSSPDLYIVIDIRYLTPV